MRGAEAVFSETVALYRFSYGTGVERVFLLHSPKIAKIEVVRTGKVRKGKLYYLRGTSGKASKVKELIAKAKKEWKEAMTRFQQKSNQPLNSLEEKRLEALLSFEKSAWSNGYQSVAGVDEAGRGPLAGPVVAAACIFPPDFLLEGVNDSKLLSPLKRLCLFQTILSSIEISYGIGIVDALIIDEINILQATFQAMLLAISSLQKTPDYLLIDGNQMPATSIPGIPIIGGDGKSQSIAAASIIAKQTRDQLMLEYHLKWPVYGFDQHKGYGTKAHLAAIAKHGPCPIHRMTFAPLRDCH